MKKNKPIIENFSEYFYRLTSSIDFEEELGISVREEKMLCNVKKITEGTNIQKFITYNNGIFKKDINGIFTKEIYTFQYEGVFNDFNNDLWQVWCENDKKELKRKKEKLIELSIKIENRYQDFLNYKKETILEDLKRIQTEDKLIAEKTMLLDKFVKHRNKFVSKSKFYKKLLKKVEREINL